MSVVIHAPETGVCNPNISDGWTVIDGEPTMTTWFEYRSPDETIVTGTWRATPGTFHATYKFHEFVYLIEGLIEITPEGGDTVIVKPGDAFTVEADFIGTWKIIEPVYKRFLLKIK
ncbi:MAG: cupin domain-containing protein [Caulobacteraceae bacterium]|nr:cupin domain-containing protein [Caulobacteraceae bacterium]